MVPTRRATNLGAASSSSYGPKALSERSWSRGTHERIRLRSSAIGRFGQRRVFLHPRRTRRSWRGQALDPSAVLACAHGGGGWEERQGRREPDLLVGVGNEKEVKWCAAGSRRAMAS